MDMKDRFKQALYLKKGIEKVIKIRNELLSLAWFRIYYQILLFYYKDEITFYNLVSLQIHSLQYLLYSISWATSPCLRLSHKP